MQLTVLGTSAAYPGPGGTCSGCLVEEGGTKLLADCGTGVLSNLQRVVALRDVSYIVISHLHADHCFDLIPYRHALTRYVLLALQITLVVSPLHGHIQPIEALPCSRSYR